ncbi:hypothetical protein VTO42DRAFT_1000 [Malbranchea cinnamomea]
MDYISYTPSGPNPNQAYMFGGQPAQQQGRPGIFPPNNLFPYDQYQFAPHAVSPTNGLPPCFAYPPPLPDPHATPSSSTGHVPSHGSSPFAPVSSEISNGGTAGDGSGGVSMSAPSSTGPSPGDAPPQVERQGKSSSDEKDMTDAQSRRKAQNRAAQRAFRERKEQRVRDLEDELSQYKEKYASLLKDNEELKRQIAKVATENEILRATAHAPIPNRDANNDNDCVEDKEACAAGPLPCAPKDQQDVTASNGPVWPNKSMVEADGTKQHAPAPPVPHRIKVCEITGERLLDASATWDLILSYHAEHNVNLDVQDIYERMKGKTRCDGQGAVIEEGHVRKAIEESLKAAKDDLL